MEKILQTSEGNPTHLSLNELSIDVHSVISNFFCSSQQVNSLLLTSKEIYEVYHHSNFFGCRNVIFFMKDNTKLINFQETKKNKPFVKNLDFTMGYELWATISISMRYIGIFPRLRKLILNDSKDGYSNFITAKNSMFKKIEAIEMKNNEICNLNGLEKFENLKQIDLSNNKIAFRTKISRDFEFCEYKYKPTINIGQFTKVEKLNLSENRIIDTNPLSSLINLTELDLGHNYIKEIKGINKLKNLTKLFLQRNFILEIKDLEGLKKLKFLDLSFNKIKEIKGLDSCVNLVDLNLTRNKIQEIKQLNGLKKLKLLKLSNNRILEIKGLESCSNLKHLNLSRNKISEIKGLENLKNLEILNLHRNSITEKKGLEKLKKLKIIRLSIKKIKEKEPEQTPEAIDTFFLNFQYSFWNENDWFEEKQPEQI